MLQTLGSVLRTFNSTHSVTGLESKREFKIVQLHSEIEARQGYLGPSLRREGGSKPVGRVLA